jgi:lysophospholipase L1-like esterase
VRVAGLLLPLFGLLLASLVLEGGLRLWAELRARSFTGSAVITDDIEADPLLVAWFKPNYQAPDGDRHFDALGFRENGVPRDDTIPHPAVLMGGSTAYGWGSADAETIAALVESRLRAAGQPNASVINAGYPGLTTVDTLLVYHERIAPLHPATVIVLAGLNDLYYAVDWTPSRRLYWSNRTYELGLRARHDPRLRPVVDAINSIALQNCFTCYAFGTGLSQLYERTRLGPALSLSQVFGQEPVGTSNSRAMRLTAWSIGELARRVRADDGCLIVAWQPIAGIPVGPRSAGERDAIDQVSHNAPTWPNIAPQMFAELRDETRPIFESGLAREVDLTDAFASVEERVYVDDGVHYTPRGNRLIADMLTPAVASSDCGA